MKFEGKGYYQYVHDRLNESLVDKLEEPLDIDETTEIAHNIIKGIAEETVLSSCDELQERQNHINVINPGIWAGVVTSIMSSKLVNEYSQTEGSQFLEIAPFVVAGIVGTTYSIYRYYKIKQIYKENDREILNVGRETAKEINALKTLLVIPSYMLTKFRESRIYYDLGLQSELHENVSNAYRTNDQSIREVYRKVNIRASVTAAIVGFLGDQTLLGVTVGVACAALSYVTNTTNIFKKPYYKRKIDAEIQRVLCEYAPEPRKGA